MLSAIDGCDRGHRRRVRAPSARWSQTPEGAPALPLRLSAFAVNMSTVQTAG